MMMMNELRETYGHNTRLLAKDLKKLFENNTKIALNPFVTSEVYILWLFEIARRRVKDSKKSTDLKKEYDELKIDEAITNLIELMKALACIFKNVFLKEKNSIASVAHLIKEELQLRKLKTKWKKKYARRSGAVR